MMPHLSRFVRPATALLCAVLVLVSAYAPAVSPRTHAQLPVTETNPVILGAVVTSASANVTSAAAEVEQSIISKILNGIAWAVAKTTIQSLTRSMVNWINSGFQGSPGFVTDLEYNLRNLQDSIADEFFDSLADNVGIDVRSPFQDQIADYLRESYYRSTGTDGFWSQNLYTAHDNEEDADAFLSGDFRRGGWDAWMKTVLYDQNNPIGAFRRAESALFRSVESARVTRLNEIQWGRGFLSWRGDCLQFEGGNQTLTQGLGFRQDENGNIVSAPQTQTAVSLDGKEKCLKYDIKTPGSVVESQLNITASSPLRQLELADSVNEIVGALVGQMVNQVLGGVGLSGLSRASSGGGGSYIDRASASDQYSNQSTGIASGLVSAIETEAGRLESMKADWEEVQRLQEEVGSDCGTASSSFLSDPERRAAAATAVQEIDAAIAETQAVLARAQSAAGSASAGEGANISSAYQNLLATNPQSDGTALAYQAQLEEELLSCSS